MGRAFFAAQYGKVLVFCDAYYLDKTSVFLIVSVGSDEYEEKDADQDSHSLHPTPLRVIDHTSDDTDKDQDGQHPVNRLVNRLDKAVGEFSLFYFGLCIGLEVSFSAR